MNNNHFKHPYALSCKISRFDIKIGIVIGRESCKEVLFLYIGSITPSGEMAK
jgi:hypothetical protein